MSHNCLLQRQIPQKGAKCQVKADLTRLFILRHSSWAPNEAVRRCPTLFRWWPRPLIVLNSNLVSRPIVDARPAQCGEMRVPRNRPPLIGEFDDQSRLSEIPAQREWMDERQRRPHLLRGGFGVQARRRLIGNTKRLKCDYAASLPGPSKPARELVRSKPLHFCCHRLELRHEQLNADEWVGSFLANKGRGIVMVLVNHRRDCAPGASSACDA
jgi:hypothetical protein